MGYSTYTTLIYGFELDAEQAKKLDEVLLKAAKFLDSNVDTYMEDILDTLKLDDISFKGDQADGRVHNCCGYEEREYDVYSYAFGVDLGDKNKNTTKIIAKGPTAEMLSKLEAVKPYLKAAGINKRKTEFHLITQTL
jgi:hypothetical protein